MPVSFRWRDKGSERGANLIERLKENLLPPALKFVSSDMHARERDDVQVGVAVLQHPQVLDKIAG
jgi:hypothetical protein